MFVSWPFSFAPILLFALLAGCATLPDVRDIVYGPGGYHIPMLMGAKGELPPWKSIHILEKLKEQSGSEDLLARQTAVIEEISGSPLVAGNRATLLKDGETAYSAMFEAIRGARGPYQPGDLPLRGRRYRPPLRGDSRAEEGGRGSGKHHL